MRYLVTGGTGLIGARIVRDLVEEGCEVVVFDIVPDGSALDRLLNSDQISENVKLIQGDVTDQPALFSAIAKNDVEVIFHTASLLKNDSDTSLLRAIKVNCEGTVNIFEAARTLGVKKVVWSSSNAVFGSAEMYSTEYISNDALYSPQSVYGATKTFNEVVAKHYYEEYGVDITGIRYMHVYGGGQRRGFFSTITKELIFNPALGLPGRVPFADALIGWSYVDDPAKATIMTSKVPMTKTRSFNIMGDVYTIKEAADYVKRLLPGADIKTIPGSLTGDPVKLDTSRIVEEIGFRPSWSMERGIKQLINDTRSANGLPPV